MSAWISSYRMYNATPTVKEAWIKLFGAVFDDLNLEVDLIDHSWPAPIEALWERADLCCAFMCGWPFINSSLPMKSIAVPVVSLPRYQNRSQYCSEFLVRSASPWTTLEQSFGHRFGFMTQNSQSGFNAPRAALAPFAVRRGDALFSAVIGPLDTPARALAALRADEADLIALDSFYLDLLRAHNPAALDGVTSIASTPWTPMPLLVASAAVPSDIVTRLAEKLTMLHTEKEYRAMLAELLISRFESPDVANYAVLNDLAASAQQLGYGELR